MQNQHNCQNGPVGAGAPKSTTGTLLVGHVNPWEAVSALLFLLGLLLSVASFSPVLLSHVRKGWLFASLSWSCLKNTRVCSSSCKWTILFVIPFPAVVQPPFNTTSLRTCSNQQGWEISSQHKAFGRSEITVKWERVSSALQASARPLETLTLQIICRCYKCTGKLPDQCPYVTSQLFFIINNYSSWDPLWFN